MTETVGDTELTDASLLDRASILISQAPTEVWAAEDENSAAWRTVAFGWLDDWHALGGFGRRTAEAKLAAIRALSHRRSFDVEAAIAIGRILDGP